MRNGNNIILGNERVDMKSENRDNYGKKEGVRI